MKVTAYNKDGLKEIYHVEVIHGDVFSPDKDNISEVQNLFNKYNTFSESLSTIMDNGMLSYKSLLYELENGNTLRLYEVKKLFNEVLSEDEHIKEIEKHTSYILNICNRPRMHLKLQHEIRPIDSVNRIDHTAISHIAAHSEHWEARTASGLIPARLYAQVLEDNIGIYENIVLKNLIDFIIIYLTKRKEMLSYARRQGGSIDWKNIKVGYGSVDFTGAMKILVRDIDNSSDSCQNAEIEKSLTRVDNLLISYLNCQNTKFYRSLKKCKKIEISETLKATNVLMMDKNYKHIRILWNYFKSFTEELGYYDKGSMDDTVPMSAYSNFVGVLTLFAISRMRFKPKDGNNQIVGTMQNGLFLIKGTFVEKDNDGYGWEIELGTEECTCSDSGINNCAIVLKFTHRKRIEFFINNQIRIPRQILNNGYKDCLKIQDYKLVFREKLNDDDLNVVGDMGQHGLGSNDTSDKRYYRLWKQFISEKNMIVPEAKEYKVVIIPLLYKFPNNSVQAKSITRIILNGCNSFPNANRVIFTTPYEITDYKKISDVKILDRLMNYGCEYSSDDADEWGNYKAGILPLSLRNINSYRRLCKVVNQVLCSEVSHKNGIFETCPFCAQKVYYNRCENCKIDLFIQECSKCNHEYIFTRPSNISEKEAETFINKVNSRNYADMREDMELLLGFFNITDLHYTSGLDILKTPVCPKCGFNSNSEGIK